MRKLIFRTFGALTALAWATSSLAQDAATPAEAGSTAPAETRPEEIVVTAQRRVQIAREVPLALSALDPETVERLKLEDVTSLSETVPGISSVYQGTLQPFVVVRGISSNSVGIGGEASVGIFVDDAYIGRITSQSVPFLDVERIEVLRGPQGSLYGRNSTGGAISIITNKPRFKETSLDLTGSYGSFDAYDATAVANLPLGEIAAARVALLARGEDGYDRNVITGRDDQSARIYGGRLSFALAPSTDFSANLSVSYSSERAGGLPFKTTVPDLAAASGVDTDPFSGDFAQNFNGNERRRVLGGNLTLNYEFSDSLSAKSVTSYNRTTYSGLYDIDGSAVPLQELRFDEGRIESVGQEFRLSIETGALRVQVGGNAFFERVDDERSLTYDETVVLPFVTAAIFGSPDGAVPADTLAPGSPAFIPCDATSVALLGVGCSPRQREAIFQVGRYRSFAAFVDAELKLSPELTLIAGGRYSTDRKRFRYNTPLVLSQGSLLAGTNLLLRASTEGEVRQVDIWKDFQPRVVLRWQLSELLNIYGSVTRGFKSGGFDPAARNGIYDPELTQFEAESVWSYELGLKAALFDRLAEVNLAGYRYNYKGFQVQVLRDGITSTLNVPQYDAWGAEADITLRPMRSLTFALGGAYNSATFGDFIVDDRFNPGAQQNLSGNRGIVAPEFSTFARADATVPLGTGGLGLRLGADVTWRSRQFFTIFGDVRESQADYALVGARVALEPDDGRWSVAVNARNLLDQNYLTSAVEQGFGISTFRGRPQSFTLDLKYDF